MGLPAAGSDVLAAEEPSANPMRKEQVNRWVRERAGQIGARA